MAIGRYNQKLGLSRREGGVPWVCLRHPFRPEVTPDSITCQGLAKGDPPTPEPASWTVPLTWVRMPVSSTDWAAPAAAAVDPRRIKATHLRWSIGPRGDQEEALSAEDVGGESAGVHTS